MRKAPRLLFALMTLWLCACSEKNAQPTETPPSGVIPQAQLDAMNKAKEVENTIMEGEQKRRAQADQ